MLRCRLISKSIAERPFLVLGFNDVRVKVVKSISLSKHLALGSVNFVSLALRKTLKSTSEFNQIRCQTIASILSKTTLLKRKLTGKSNSIRMQPGLQTTLITKQSLMLTQGSQGAIQKLKVKHKRLKKRRDLQQYLESTDYVLMHLSQLELRILTNLLRMAFHQWKQ